MLSYLMPQVLLKALAGGAPYHVYSLHNVHAVSETQLLAELLRRGLITSGALPVLTEAGIAEANWFKNNGSQR
jgi:hypothetical protein